NAILPDERLPTTQPRRVTVSPIWSFRRRIVRVSVMERRILSGPAGTVGRALPSCGGERGQRRRGSPLLRLLLAAPFARPGDLAAHAYLADERLVVGGTAFVHDRVLRQTPAAPLDELLQLGLRVGLRLQRFGAGGDQEPLDDLACGLQL